LRGVQQGTVIIRTHGAPPSVMEAMAKNQELSVVDATCPIVSRSQRIAKRLADEGYKVVIVGDRHHPEVKGVLGFAGERAEAVNTLDEVEALGRCAKIGVLAQTTITMQHFQRMVQALITKALEFKVINTLCNETTKTQASTLELAGEVQMMVVIGGKNSANTKHLVELCQEQGLETYHIEEAAELNPAWFAGKEKVGVTAGASTPDWIIESVLNELKLIANGGHSHGPNHHGHGGPSRLDHARP
jgi:4-hydroxy-3-methylbut-2-enyl diphosphate reductase